MDVKQQVEAIVNRPYSFMAVADHEAGGWVIFYPDLPGVMTQADTYEEAAVMAKEALETWVEAALEDGRPIPEPTFDADPNWDWTSVRPTNELPTMTTEEVARELGVSVARVHQLARARHVGQRRGHGLMFSQRDIDRMRVRRPGRPPEHEKISP